MPKKVENIVTEDTSNGAESEAPMIETAPVWLSEKQATEYLGFKRLSAIKHAIRDKMFPLDAIRTRVVHPDFPMITEITQDALNDWRDSQRKPEKVAAVGRRGKTSPRKIVVKVLDADYERFKALNTDAGFEVVGAAYKPRGKKAADVATSAAESNDESQPDQEYQATSDLFQADLVEA